MNADEIAEKVMRRIHDLIIEGHVADAQMRVLDVVRRIPEEELMRDLKPPYSPLAVALFKSAAVSSDIAKAKKIAGNAFRIAEKEAGE